MNQKGQALIEALVTAGLSFSFFMLTLVVALKVLNSVYLDQVEIEKIWILLKKGP